MRKLSIDWRTSVGEILTVVCYLSYLTSNIASIKHASKNVFTLPQYVTFLSYVIPNINRSRRYMAKFWSDFWRAMFFSKTRKKRKSWKFHQNWSAIDIFSVHSWHRPKYSQKPLNPKKWGCSIPYISWLKRKFDLRLLGNYC